MSYRRLPRGVLVVAKLLGRFTPYIVAQSVTTLLQRALHGSRILVGTSAIVIPNGRQFQELLSQPLY